MFKGKISLLFVLDPVNLSTGSCRSTIRFMTLLLKRGYSISVLCDDSPASYKIGFPEKVKVYRVKSYPLFFDRNQWLALPKKYEISKIIEEDKVDIIHTIMPTIASLRVIKIAKEYNLKIVTHSHTQPENFTPFIPKMFWSICKFLFNRYLVYFYGKGDIVLCPSKFSESLLHAESKDLKTKVISNGVEFEKFKPGKNVKGRINLLFVARLDPEKDVNTLINAVPLILKEHKGISLRIVGVGSQEGSAKDLVKHLSLDKYVKFSGRVSEEELINAYQGSDIFILPSLVELEGMVVLEAMASGNAVVVADSKDSASHHLVSGNGLVFKTQNPKDLAKKINFLIEHPKILNNMKKMSRVLAKDYDINKSVDKLDEVYRKLLS